ncbi:hypothetical protein [Paractinoplanes atraurantiacus]|uniref:DUF1963 domain-containing protein n=1 Tax=Paractinoplanes atraurantiacus TaxID=1036182 RepID=A0A285H740_9ACTN|nr:hypothetical protein [Actinoplanes atraurantiacus]SNY31434.1 hypothetical protein SAMN05421748_103559 [Actinoplanes atraurantiacus]
MTRRAEIEEAVPGLREYARDATRLRPAPGEPSAAESSVGGPLLWPAGEAWPHCADDDHYLDRLLTVETVWRQRRIYAAAQARAAATGKPYEVTDAERAELPGYDYSEPHAAARRPIALVPVAQLYRRDVPGIDWPEDADLLQVLWCPLDHESTGYNPRVEFRWRRAGDVGVTLGSVPQPAVVNEDYLATPCVVRPEVVREHEYDALLPDELRAQAERWADRHGLDYDDDLSVAPGWKAGGFASWSLSDWHAVDCATCGSPMKLLITAASSEDDGTPRTPTDVVIGRGYSLYVFACPRDARHPPGTAMQ